LALVDNSIEISNVYFQIRMPASILTELVDKSLPKSYIESFLSEGGTEVPEQRRQYKDYLFYQADGEDIIFINNAKDFNSKNSTNIFSSLNNYSFLNFFCKPENYENLIVNE